MKLGCLIALTIIAHNIFKNQPDRIKLWPTEFWENTTLSPKNRFFGPNNLEPHFLEFWRYVRPAGVILRQKMDLAVYTAISKKIR